MRANKGFRIAGLVAAGTVALAGVTISGSASADAPAQIPAALVHQGTTETTVRVGPFVLPPAPSPGIPIVNQFVPNLPKPCENCYVTAVEPELVDAAGNRADMSTGVMLHHAVIADAAKDDVTCARNDGQGVIGRRIFASGDERTPIRMPHGFGYKVDPGPWVGLFDLMNFSTEQRVVFFQATIEHVPATSEAMKAITPVWLDMDNCRTSVYSVPPGRSETRWSWNSTLTGRIVAAGGHVHAGGVGLTLDNTTTKQRICASRAGYGSGAMAGMVTSMSTCSWNSLGALHSGDQLTLTSIYDAPRAMNDVMGIMLIAVWETDDVDGGSRAPAAMRDLGSSQVPAEAGHDHGGGGHGH